MENQKLGQEPAFAMSNSELNFNKQGVVKDESNGMSKRFYAACAAMQGIMANSNSEMINLDAIGVARIAFEYADELLKQENL